MPSFINNDPMNRFSLHYYVKCKSTVFLILTILSVGSSQKKIDNHIFFTSAELVIDVLPGNDTYYSFPISKGISIYNLAEIFQLKADKIFAINHLNPSQPINDGRIVKIPCDHRHLVTDKTKLQKNKDYVPVFYKVKKGDTAYKICKQYFDLEPKEFLKLNDKNQTDIDIGEKILIGWQTLAKTKIAVEQPKLMKTTQPIKKDETTKTIVPVLPKDTSAQLTKKMPVTKYYESDVIGWWDKSSQNHSGSFALHNEAKPGSVIDIYNPMLKSHVKAKVLGKIPPDTYFEDVQIILSPEVIKELRILDTRYMVNIKFEK